MPTLIILAFIGAGTIMCLMPWIGSKVSKRRFTRPLCKRDFPLGGDEDLDAKSREAYRQYCKDESNPDYSDFD